MEMNESPNHDSADALNRQRLRSRTRRHRLTGLNAGVATALFFTLILMINYVSMHRYARFDLSRSGEHVLSGKTKALLASLEQPVHVTVFIQPDHQLFHVVYEDTVQLLRAYAEMAKGNLTMERIDPDRHPGRAEELINRFSLDRINVVVLEYAGRSRIVDLDDLAVVNYLPVASGGLPQPEAFLGEIALSSAIMALLEEQPPRVYFLQGYGERDFDDHDDYVGMSEIGQRIRRDFIELLPLNMAERNAIPEDADVLIIAGPSRAYPQAAVERIANFAERDGSLILLLNAETDAGFGDLLASWGVQSIDNIVVDPTRTVSGFDVLIPDYPDHPVTEHLDRMTSLFYWPRALPMLSSGDRDLDASDKPQARALVLSSDRAWAERDLDRQPYTFDKDIDLQGPLPLAVTIERGTGGPEALSLSLPRMAVFGDVDFISNNGLSGANADLFLNTLNWVLDRDQLLDIAARPFSSVRLMIDQQGMWRLFWIVVVGIPAVAALTGMGVWWRRRI